MGIGRCVGVDMLVWAHTHHHLVPIPNTSPCLHHPSPDDAAVIAAVAAYMHSTAFGTPSDPVCEWLYGWALSDHNGSHPRPNAMARFVARCVPLMLTQALQRAQPLPGLDVCVSGGCLYAVCLLICLLLLLLFNVHTPGCCHCP